MYLYSHLRLLQRLVTSGWRAQWRALGFPWDYLQGQDQPELLGLPESRAGAGPGHQQRRKSLASQPEEERGHQGLLDHGSCNRLDPGTLKDFQQP